MTIFQLISFRQSSRVKLSLLLAAAGLSFVAPAYAADSPKQGGTLTAIVQPEPVTLTPAFNTATPTQIVAGNVFDGLVYYDPELKPQPSLATEWKVAEDGLTISFSLRKGVKWHDGKPFSSADVKWSLENVWKTIHPRNKAIFENVATVETPDDSSIILHLSKPSLPILSVLNAVGAPILPKHLYEGTDVLNNPYNNKPVGTGAFVFKEWKKGEYILLERNLDYWEPAKPYLDKVIFRIIPDAAARAAAIEKGEVQYATFNPVSFREVERFGKLPSLKVETRGYDWLSPVLYLDFNVEKQFLKDVRVRQAIAFALDKEALGKVVWYGYGKPAISPVPTALTAFHDPSVPKYPFDLKKADALLDEAGFKRGVDGVRFTLTHDFLPYGDDYKRTGEYLKQALKRVGIEINIRGQDTAAFIKRIYGDRDFDISSSYNGAFPDPQIGVVREYWSGWLGTKTPWTNGSGYRNVEVDALIQAAAVEGNPKKRTESFNRFQQIVQRDLPTLPLLELQFFTVHSSALKNVVLQGDQSYGSLKNAWLDRHPAQN